MIQKINLLLFIAFILPPSVFGQNWAITTGTNLFFTTESPLTGVNWNKDIHPKLGLQTGLRYTIPLITETKLALNADMRYYRTHIGVRNTSPSLAWSNVSGNINTVRVHLAPSICIYISDKWSLDLGVFTELPILYRFNGSREVSSGGSSVTEQLPKNTKVLDDKNQGLWFSPRFRINEKGTTLFLSYNMGTKSVYYKRGTNIWYALLATGIHFPL
jgi:hypothetical protein